MNADRHPIVERIADLVNVVAARGQGFDMTGFQADGRALLFQAAVSAAGEALRILGAAQHADQSPDAVIVNRRALTRSPDKTDNGEALAGIGMQQKLLITRRVRDGEFVGQPVVIAYQLPQQLTAAVQQIAFARVAVDQFGQRTDESPESFGVSGLGHLSSVGRDIADSVDQYKHNTGA